MPLYVDRERRGWEKNVSTLGIHMIHEELSVDKLTNLSSVKAALIKHFLLDMKHPKHQGTSVNIT